jgi:hypothetical protein
LIVRQSLLRSLSMGEIVVGSLWLVLAAVCPRIAAAQRVNPDYCSQNCTLPAPTITISGMPSFDSVSSAAPSVKLCESAGSLGADSVHYDGADSTSKFPFTGPSCQTANGSVTLQLGTNTLRVYACTASGNGYTGTCANGVASTVYEPVAVRPTNGRDSGEVNLPATATFQVTNFATTSTTFTLSVACSGAGASGCAVPTPLTVPASTTTPVVVSFLGGALGSYATIALTATSTANSAVTATGSILYSATWTPSLIVSTRPTNTDNQDMRRCAVNCFAATASVATVPYVSRDTPRSVALVYNGDRVTTKPFVYADVSVAAGYTLSDLQFQVQVNGAFVTFTNGETLLHFNPAGVEGSGKTYRLAGQFDASSLTATGLYAMRIVVTADYADGHSDQVVDSSHVLPVLNTRQSGVARGWTIVGVPFIYSYFPPGGGSNQTSVMIPNGDGTVAVFRNQQCATLCTWTSPVGDYTLLHTVSGGSGDTYERVYPDSSKQVFNSTGQLVAQISRTQDTVVFAYNGCCATGSLASVSDPFPPLRLESHLYRTQLRRRVSFLDTRAGCERHAGRRRQRTNHDLPRSRGFHPPKRERSRRRQHCLRLRRTEAPGFSHGSAAQCHGLRVQCALGQARLRHRARRAVRHCEHGVRPVVQADHAVRALAGGRRPDCTDRRVAGHTGRLQYHPSEDHRSDRRRHVVHARSVGRGGLVVRRLRIVDRHPARQRG